MITEVKSKDKIYAIVFDLSSIEEGTFPVTDPLWSIQLLLMKRKQGHLVKRHTHKKIRKYSEQPQEAIVVIKGVIEADIFDNENKFIAKINATAGQCLLIVDGVHEVKVIKDALLYAFKDGPFVDDKISL